MEEDKNYSALVLILAVIIAAILIFLGFFATVKSSFKNKPKTNQAQNTSTLMMEQKRHIEEIKDKQEDMISRQRQKIEDTKQRMEETKDKQEDIMKRQKQKLEDYRLRF